MMAHLLDSLGDGKDIGHYGRLVFVMVARHKVEPDDLVDLLTQDKTCSEEEARRLVSQVSERGYNPPRREKILEFRSRQDFPIVPDPDDPNAGNVYKDLAFPDEVYHHIEEYYDEKHAAE
jgi:hypothetical protein